MFTTLLFEKTAPFVQLIHRNASDSLHSSAKRWRVASFLAVCLLSATELAHAQTGNGSAEFLQEQRRIEERNRQLQLQQMPAPNIRLTPDEKKSVDSQDAAAESGAGRLPQNETPCFNIYQIDLRHPQASSANPNRLANKLESNAEASDTNAWSWLMASFNRDAQGKNDNPIGQCLGSEGINILAARAQDALLKKGYSTTRILVAPQDLNSGNLVFTIVEGRIASILPHPQNTAKDNARLSIANAFEAKAGDVLQLRDIEQGLENLKRLPTAEADIEIKPSSDDLPGYSDLLIKYKQDTSERYRFAPLRYALSIDDSGNKSTGKYQHTHTVNWDNPLHLNDLFYISYTRDLGGTVGSSLNSKNPGERGTGNYAVHYSIPYVDWSFAINASRNKYNQTVAGAFSDIIYNGQSASQDLKVSKLLYRNATSKTFANFKLWSKQSKNFIDNTEIEVQRRRTGGIEWGLNHRQTWDDTTFDISLSYRRGTGFNNAIEAPESAFGEGASRPKIASMDGNVSHPFNLGIPIKASANWRTQWNRTPLIPADRFVVGGRSTVRGYDGSLILSTERGYVIRTELETPIAKTGIATYMAYDYGHVGGETAQFMLVTKLQSAALGFRISGATWSQTWLKGLYIDAYIGSPVKKADIFKTKHRAYGFNLSWAI